MSVTSGAIYMRFGGTQRPLATTLFANLRFLPRRAWHPLREYALSSRTPRVSGKGGSTAGAAAAGPPRATSTTIEADRELVYVGPFAQHARRFKWYALLLSACGILVIPTILVYGEKPIAGAFIAGTAALAPVLFVNALTNAYVARLYVHRRPLLRPSTPSRGRSKQVHADNTMITLETLTWLGVPNRTDVRLSDLRESTSPFKWVTWKRTSGGPGKRDFFIEKALMRRDPRTKELLEYIEARTQSANEST